MELEGRPIPAAPAVDALDMIFEKLNDVQLGTYGS